MTTLITTACPPDAKALAGDLNRAALHVADCRSLRSLGNALFGQASAVVGISGAGFYLFNSGNRLQLISSHFAPADFLNECDREFYKAGKIHPMLNYIITERRAVDGFHLHGAARWRHSRTYSLMREGGFYHNVAGAFLINGRLAGALFAATTEDNPFDLAQVKAFDLLCRAASVSLTAMRDRERLRCELSGTAIEDWRDFLSIDNDRLPAPQSDHASGTNPGNLAQFGHGRSIDRLPPRSRAVAHLLCQGESNKGIARQLGISIYTVKEHVKGLCRRFDALNRTELVHYLSISS